LPRKPSILRLAIDTGGTFTDCVWQDASGALRMAKVFSTPADPSRAIESAIDEAKRATGHEGPVLLLHGTTVGTNALLQRTGARVAFVTTLGFEDSIQIGRQARPKLYDFFFDAIEPLVPDELRFAIDERTDKDGNILRSPSSAELDDLKARVEKAGPQAIAISLLFSFANPVNEQALATKLEELKLPLSVSHQILPEFREYERASTVVMNAYLQPLLGKYLCMLSGRVSSIAPAGKKEASRIFVMQSSGGLASLAMAAREPVRTVLSGPAGGVIGASRTAARAGFRRIIGFDMGGTSTDVCLVDGAPATTNEAEVAGLPVRVPMLNIHTVGAGGGSLARFDLGGALRVGPESAGADPGPICYGRGTQPTVTDANLLLGRLPADKFLGGTFALDVARTENITRKWQAETKSDLSMTAFAEGVVRVVNATMEKAIRLVSVEKGYDPRDFTLVAFGGAGALHACELAAGLEIPRVLVPAMPGALSAVGILMSDVVKDHSRTVMLAARGRLDHKALREEYSALSSRARAEFQEEGWAGRVTTESSLDLRYKGQGFEINVKYSPRALEDFHAEHKRRYGHADPAKEVEVVTVRLRSTIVSDRVTAKSAPAETGTRNAKPESAKIFFHDGWRAAKIYSRDSLPSRIHGPAIVTEASATTVVPPGWSCAADKRALVLTAV
jgi:N-methylhydantoinase A